MKFKKISICALLLPTILLSGCEKKVSFEEANKKINDAINNNIKQLNEYLKGDKFSFALNGNFEFNLTNSLNSIQELNYNGNIEAKVNYDLASLNSFVDKYSESFVKMDDLYELAKNSNSVYYLNVNLNDSDLLTTYETSYGTYVKQVNDGMPIESVSSKLSLDGMSQVAKSHIQFLNTVENINIQNPSVDTFDNQFVEVANLFDEFLKGNISSTELVNNLDTLIGLNLTDDVKSYLSKLLDEFKKSKFDEVYKVIKYKEDGKQFYKYTLDLNKLLTKLKSFIQNAYDNLQVIETVEFKMYLGKILSVYTNVLDSINFNDSFISCYMSVNDEMITGIGTDILIDVDVNSQKINSIIPSITEDISVTCSLKSNFEFSLSNEYLEIGNLPEQLLALKNN